MATPSELAGSTKNMVLDIALRVAAGVAVVGAAAPLTACGYPVGEPVPVTTEDREEKYFDVPAGTPVYPGSDVSKEVPCGAITVPVAAREVSQKRSIVIPLDRQVYHVVELTTDHIADIDGVNVDGCKDINGAPLRTVWVIRDVEKTE